MSQVKREIIECPHCHQEGEFELWTSVNVDLDLELREKIFSDELFMYRCPHCGKVTGIPAGFLYHDMTHKFMIFFDFFKPDDYDYSPMEIPEGIGLQKEYLFRAVFGLQRFKEKIIILEHGLNDVAIEHQKYMISHVIMPEIAEKGYELFFSKTEEPNEDFFMARKSLDEKMNMEVHPRSLDKEFVERMHHPIGLDEEYYPVNPNEQEEPTEGSIANLIRHIVHELMLDDFLDEEGKPKQVFQGLYSWKPGISRDTFIKAANEFLDFCEPFVDKRADRIIDKLEKVLSNNH